MLGHFLRLTIALAASAAAADGAPLVTQSWFFTTDTRLTIDVRLAAGVQADWSKCAVVVAPTRGGAPIQRRALAPGLVQAEMETGVQRIALDGFDVARWSPVAPNLYRVTLELSDQAGRHESVEQRVGFRSFTTQGGRIFLNGRPIFLRGLAINPPNRGIPEKLERSRGFAEDYVRYLRSLHVNIIRIPDDPTWYDVCDELGMMVFGGNYSSRIAGAGSNADREKSARWFREEKFHPFVHHPALMIYALTNETPYLGINGDKWADLLGDMHRRLQPWDPTRLYIANAGYGYGRIGEINDLHRYWGWYYESPFTFLHLRDDPKIVAPGKVQPLTFTECVGNYIGPDGRTNLTPNHKNPLAQQNWTGHASTLELGQLGFEHQSHTIRQATELFRRLRPINPELSGVFPFTILFNHWHDITSFADMDPKPAARQLRASYQPVLLSWELYTPQVYAGTELRPIAHVVNDDDDGRDLRGATLTCEVRDSTQRTVATVRATLPDVAYYGTARVPLKIALPADLSTGVYSLVGIVSRSGAMVSENRVDVFIASPGFARGGNGSAMAVRLFDPNGTTRRVLARAGILSTALEGVVTLDATSPVIIGEDAAARLSADEAKRLDGFVREGGRLVVLRQSNRDAVAVARLLPVPVRMPATDIDDPTYPPPRPSRNTFNVNPERPDHPVFSGIERRRLQIWSDPSQWDEQKPGLPRIHPATDGFVLTRKADIATTAVLANYGPGLEGVALAEFFAGRGSVLFSGFDLVARAGLDPVADRLLRNIVGYAAQSSGHERHVLIDAPIAWGRYETEKGVLTGINSGLMLNSRPALTGSYRDMPIVVTPDGHEFAGGPGGWNNRPGIVYVPFGRRPFGPYSHHGWSGVPAPDAELARPVTRDRSPDAIYEEPETISGHGGEGEGHFWCRIPEGRTRATHRVFNPSPEKLTVRVRANQREATATLAAGATATLDVPLDAGVTIVETTVRGDRRLVLLETTFE